ncbi:MAG: hydrolase [Candidatus Rokubacteria bacterium]|nr:hydrolase [Candidatus Rokubacteria bacterium]
MAAPTRLTREGSLLLVVDVQERLFAAMDPEHREEMVKNIKALVTLARRLGIPVQVSEQYPKGLGHTLPELKEMLGDVEPIEKVAFSCCGTEGFADRLKAIGARQVVLAGIEAHVCVLLTALDLLAQGYGVHVVADATCSRRRENRRIALDQLQQAGAVVTSTESVLFQLLRTADTEDFRVLSKLIK